MRFTYPESVGVEDLEVAVRPIADVLRSEGIDRVTSLTITFHGWREDTCYLMADKGGFIHTMNVPSPSHGNEQEGMTYALPEGAGRGICLSALEFVDEHFLASFICRDHRI